LLIGPHHDTADRFFDWYNVWVVLSELLIFVPITFMILLLSKKMR
jgi:inner membrane protein